MRLLAVIAFFMLAGPLLAIFGPPILNGFEEAIGTQPTPPDRPRGVAPSARSFYGPEAGWWWGDCLERGGARYDCAVWNANGTLVIAGKFIAVTEIANNWTTRRRPRLPKPQEALHVRGYLESIGELDLNHPHGWLVPEGWIFHPATKTKVRVSGTRGSSLTEPVAMTEEDLREVSALAAR